MDGTRYLGHRLVSDQHAVDRSASQLLAAAYRALLAEGRPPTVAHDTVQDPPRRPVFCVYQEVQE